MGPARLSPFAWEDKTFSVHFPPQKAEEQVLFLHLNFHFTSNFIQFHISFNFLKWKSIVNTMKLIQSGYIKGSWTSSSLLRLFPPVSGCRISSFITKLKLYMVIYDGSMAKSWKSLMILAYWLSSLNYVQTSFKKKKKKSHSVDLLQWYRCGRPAQKVMATFWTHHTPRTLFLSTGSAGDPGVYCHILKGIRN